MSDAVRIELNGPVATVKLVNPGKRNVMSDLFWDEFRAAIDTIEDSTPNVVVLVGSGESFSAGGDITRMEHILATNDVSALREFEGRRLTRINEVLIRWSRIPGVRLAIVNGPALGGGLSLALSSDFRLMAENAFLNTSFARIGLPGDTGITYHLDRLLGAHRARMWLLMPRDVSAQEAFQLGLVDEVVVPECLSGRADELIGLFGAIGRDFTSMVFRRDEESSLLAAALERELENTLDAKVSSRHRELVGTFMSGRQKVRELSVSMLNGQPSLRAKRRTTNGQEW